MKDEWLKDIHDRMEDFEADAPQGLWEAICAAESEGAATAATGKNRRLWAWGAVAACLLMFAISHPAVNRKEDNAIPVAEQRVAPKHNVVTGKSPLAHKAEPAAKDNTLTTNTIDSPSAGAASPAHKTDLPASADAAKRLSQDSADTAAAAEIASDDSTAAAPVRFGSCGNLAQHLELEETTTKSKGNGQRFELALMSAAGNGAKTRQIYSGGDISSAFVGDSEWSDSPLLGIMTMNKGAETERQATFYTPVRSGVSFRYKLNDRWGIETGLSYAFVSSKIIDGSAANYVEEKQYLHYIGIPLGVSCKVMSWRKLELYVSGNVLAEQCVYAKSDKHFYIANKALGEDAVPIAAQAPQWFADSPITSRPLQWSLGAKVGLQYNFSNMFSVYAEPGGSYYFDDHSPLETVFKKRPFDFSLNVGLRCSFVKKKA